MKAIIQRVKKATLFSDYKKYSEIENGIIILFGVNTTDKVDDVEKFAQKLLKLRIFEDEFGKTNKSIFDTSGEILIVSNFTLYANLKGTNRPDFTNVAKQDIAEEIYNKFCDELNKQINIKTGVFRTHMEIETILDGPNTYILEI